MTADVHNTAVKAQRETSMKVGYVPTCATTELEVQVQSYNRGIVGSYPVKLEFDYKFEKPVEIVEGLFPWLATMVNST